MSDYTLVEINILTSQDTKNYLIIALKNIKTEKIVDPQYLW